MLEVKRESNGPATRTAARVPTAPAYAEPIAEMFSERVLIPGPVSAGTAAAPTRLLAPVLVQPVVEFKDLQTRTPVIVGEAHYKGTIAVDGIITGQLGAGASLNVRQRSKAFFASPPELSGEINFRDMLRVNGFIAGTVYSKMGTLIVDTSSRVDANVEVAVAVICGCVNGDIVAHERVEIGPNAEIHGNIWTRSIQIKDGAIFEGVCRMIGG